MTSRALVAASAGKSQISGEFPHQATAKSVRTPDHRDLARPSGHDENRISETLTATPWSPRRYWTPALNSGGLLLHPLSARGNRSGGRPNQTRSMTVTDTPIWQCCAMKAECERHKY